MVLPVPDAYSLTVIVFVVTLILLLFPSLLAWWTKNRAITQSEKILQANIKRGEKPDLDKIAQVYSSTDVESITASTRMTIATIALLIVGICLFSLMGLTAYTTSLASESSNANFTDTLTTFSNNYTQIFSIVLGILGGVLSAAVGFYFGSQTQTSTQLAAKGLEEAKIEVQNQINATEAAKKQFEAITEELNKAKKPPVEPQTLAVETPEEPSEMID